MSSVCFDIVVPPVNTCYVYKFYETKTNNYLKHISHMQTKGLRIYNIFYTSTCIIQINFVLNLNRGQSVTSRELNLPFQMPSFLYHRVYASSLEYKYNELKCLILHNDELGRLGDILPKYAGVLTRFPQSGVFWVLALPQYRWNEYFWG